MIDTKILLLISRTSANVLKLLSVTVCVTAQSLKFLDQNYVTFQRREVDFKKPIAIANFILNYPFCFS